MKLCGGLSNRTVSTRPVRSVSNVGAICFSLSGCLSLVQGAERLGGTLGDPSMNGHVFAAIDRHLDQRRLSRDLGELVEPLDADVREPVEGGDLRWVEPERSAEQRLELLALDLLGLGQ